MGRRSLRLAGRPWDGTATALAVRSARDGLACTAIIITLTAVLTGPVLAKSRPPQFLRACQPPEAQPLPLIQPSKTKGDTDDNDDADDSDDDDEEDSKAGGLRLPGLASCVKVSGTVTAGLQRDWYHAGALAKATGQVPKSGTSFPLTVSFRIESGQELEGGQALLTAFEFQTTTETDGSESMTLTEASVTIGAWQFGYADSRFDFWTGDDFIMLGRIPSRTVNLIAFSGSLGEATTLSLSLEDTAAGNTPSAVTTAGRRVPDGILRLLYDTDLITLHAALAVRDVPGAMGAPDRIGRAGLVGASWNPKLWGRELRLSGQIAGAIDAPPYIGSQLDRRTALPLLLPDDSTRGWSAVVSAGWDWTKTWSSNAYVSRYRLSLPGSGTQASIAIDRITGNLVWKPVDGFKSGVELSVAKQRTNLAAGRLAVALAGQQTSVQVFLERSF